jgi:hypothetical protein
MRKKSGTHVTRNAAEDIYTGGFLYLRKRGDSVYLGFFSCEVRLSREKWDRIVSQLKELAEQPLNTAHKPTDIYVGMDIHCWDCDCGNVHISFPPCTVNLPESYWKYAKQEFRELILAWELKHSPRSIAEIGDNNTTLN